MTMKDAARTSSDCVTAFADVAGRQPDHVAILDDGRSITYGDLARDIQQRAASLVTAGLKAGDRVALVAESSADFLAMALAVWSAHGVLVTIYPSSGADDLEYALQSCDPALIVAGAEVMPRLVGSIVGNTPVASVEEFAPTAVRTQTEPNPSDLREPLSLICFSSGTTSRPKAIMQSARAVYNCAATYGEVWHFGPEDRGIVCLPMAWMYGLASTSLALLLQGSTVVVVRRSRPEILLSALITHRATFLAGVTTTFTKLVQHMEAVDFSESAAIDSLRLCISGGEPRNEDAFERWRSLTGVAVLDAYCSSECLPLVTYDPQVDPTPLPGSAGKVVPRSRLKIVGPNGNELPPGEVGEAYSSGLGLMLGYWRDPESTRDVLTDDGWYKTKDLVRIDDAGYVHVVGRLSDVIIRAGVNISPAEVERVVAGHEGVAEVAVVGLPDEISGQRVVAAIVPRVSLDLAAVDGFVRERLTAYKAPSEYVLVESLPVNATSGKIDRRALASSLQSRLRPVSAQEL